MLEIGAECHYHSGLFCCPGICRGLEPPKKQVITNMKIVTGVAMALVADEDVARLGRYFSRLEGLETTKPE